MLPICSIPQSKKFKKLGVKQFSYVHHYLPKNNNMGEKKGVYCLRHAGTKPSSPKGWENYWSAYTVGELGEMLPDWVYSKKNSAGGEKWVCFMVDNHVNLPKKMKQLKDFYADDEAEVRAKMLIYLLEKKFISLVSVNRIVATF